MIRGLFNNTRIIEKALDASFLRNEIISHNIANVDTPGYKRYSVQFEEILNGNMEARISGLRTNDVHIPIGKDRKEDIQPKVIRDNRESSMRIDGNNVDIEKEMAEMAKNSIKYQIMIQNINSSFRRLKNVINEGR
ncbi:MAG TPA: flagellar basal body rod protein FlgB [Clostridiaceae bacterium]|nr:flagellar basal body rod protein FlgB [Clostridiaceae bacterium]